MSEYKLPAGFIVFASFPADEISKQAAREYIAEKKLTSDDCRFGKPADYDCISVVLKKETVIL